MISGKAGMVHHWVLHITASANLDQHALQQLYIDIRKSQEEVNFISMLHQNKRLQETIEMINVINHDKH